jgi:CPA1 family monovalent cation:H+ antiporter
LPDIAGRLGIDAEVAEHLRSEYDRRLRILRDGEVGDGIDAAGWEQQYTDLQLALLAHKHDTVIQLRDEGQIDDEVLRQIQDTLDLEKLQTIRRRDV